MPPENPSGLVTSRYHILVFRGLLKKDLNVTSSNELAVREFNNYSYDHVVAKNLDPKII